MPTLYPLFFENLQDSIASVRQGAAVALSNVVRAYGRCSRWLYFYYTRITCICCCNHDICNHDYLKALGDLVATTLDANKGYICSPKPFEGLCMFSLQHLNHL